MNKENKNNALFLVRVLIFFIVALIVCFFADESFAGSKPFVVHGILTHEDDDYWYHNQSLSDGSTREHKVRKPLYWLSRDLVATNEHPVTWEYIYEVKRCDGSIISNSVYQAKTKRERAQIKMPPMPDIITPEPGKLDVFGHAAKRRKKTLKIDEEIIYKSMRKHDRIKKREIKDGKIINHFRSGRQTIEPIKRMYTARVKEIEQKERRK